MQGLIKTNRLEILKQYIILIRTQTTLSVINNVCADYCQTIQEKIILSKVFAM